MLIADLARCLLEKKPLQLSSFLPAFGMTRWTESAGLAGKHKQALFPTVRTSDAGKAAHRIAAVKLLLDNLLDDWPKEAILPLETILIFPKEPPKIIEEHPILLERFNHTSG
jgi:hypothetical protein